MVFPDDTFSLFCLLFGSMSNRVFHLQSFQNKDLRGETTGNMTLSLVVKFHETVSVLKGLLRDLGTDSTGFRGPYSKSFKNVCPVVLQRETSRVDTTSTLKISPDEANIFRWRF